MDETSHCLITDSDKRVYVVSLADTLLSRRPELPLDSRNGLNKVFGSSVNIRCIIDGITRSVRPNTEIFKPNNVPH